MGQLDWSTPPTESEIQAGFNTPPTSEEMSSVPSFQDLPPEGSIPSYADVETHGMAYPRRDIMDVLTGRGTSPEEAQQRANQRYVEQNVVGSPEAIESVTPMADFFNPLVVPAKIAGATALGYGAYKGGQALKNSIFKTTDELDTVAKQMGMKPEEVLELYAKDTDRVDQAYQASVQGGDVMGGNVATAITQHKDEIPKRKYAEILTERKKAMEETLGSSDKDAIRGATNEEYSSMVDFVDSTNDDISFDMNRYTDELSNLKRYAQDDSTSRQLTGILNAIEDKPLQGTRDIIELKHGLNKMFRKVNDKDAQRRIIEVKKKLDRAMKDGIGEEGYKLVKDADASWARMSSNEDALEILVNNSTTRGTGTDFERGATNWAGFRKDMKEANLMTPEINNAMLLSQKFEKKYGDMDVRLFGTTRQGGLSPEPPTLASNPVESIQVKTSRSVFDWIMSNMPFTDKKAIRKMQDAIEQSIRKADSKQEFIKNVVANKNTPDSIRKRIKSNLDAQPIRPDEIIPADKGKGMSAQPDIIDTEVVDPFIKLGNNGKKQLPFKIGN